MLAPLVPQGIFNGLSTDKQLTKAAVYNPRGRWPAVRRYTLLTDENAMPATKKDSTVVALEAVHAALKPLKPAERQRVLASVNALLGTSEGSAGSAGAGTVAPQIPEQAPRLGTSTPTRPISIRELINEKKPRTHPQFITLFAYYKEKIQGQPTFSRDSLERYYTDARETPPRNYDRDFVKAVISGWIHEDGDNSYITSKGIEMVESGFAESPEVQRHTARPKKASGSKKGKAGRARKGS